MSEKYKVIATKVRPEVKEQIGALCKSRGLNEYQMLQMMCDCIVRYMDDRHNLSSELEKAMAIFEHMNGWREAYNLADPSTDMQVAEAVYIHEDAAGKRHGQRVSWVTRWEQTDNIIDIYEHITEVMLPELYRKMKTLADEMQCANIIELLLALVDSQTAERIDEQFRNEFMDARTDNGKTLEYGERTRRKKHYTPDNMP